MERIELSLHSLELCLLSLQHIGSITPIKRISMKQKAPDTIIQVISCTYEKYDKQNISIMAQNL